MSINKPFLTRRRFLQGSFALVGSGILTGFYSWRIEPRWVQFVRRELPIRHLPPEMNGRSLVQISDIHVGDRYNWQYQIGALEEVTALDPDYVVYTGDFVTYETAVQFDQLQELLQHAPLGRLGTAAVLGNHDYGHGWNQPEVADTISQQLAEKNITILRNEARSFADLQLIGIDDYWGTNFSPAFLETVDFNQPSLALCHNPDVVDLPIWGNYAGWILAGHTHGGQIKPPFLPPPVLPVQNERYSAGAFAVGNGRYLYINRGLGNLWSVRFNARPEITLFTLTAA